MNKNCFTTFLIQLRIANIPIKPKKTINLINWVKGEDISFDSTVWHLDYLSLNLCPSMTPPPIPSSSHVCDDAKRIDWQQMVVMQ